MTIDDWYKKKKQYFRNFPTHELFGGVYERLGQEQLFNVLKAYTVLNPVAGYCQAQVKPFQIVPKAYTVLNSIL